MKRIFKNYKLYANESDNPSLLNVTKQARCIGTAPKQLTPQTPSKPSLDPSAGPLKERTTYPLSLMNIGKRLPCMLPTKDSY